MTELSSAKSTERISKTSKVKTNHLWWWVLGAVGVVSIGVIGLGLLVAGIIATRTTQSATLDIASVDPELDSMLKGMRLTARTGDWNGFCQYVDIAAVRSSIQTMVQSEIRASNRSGQVSDSEALVQSVFSGMLLQGLLTDQTAPILMHFASMVLLPDSQQRDPNITVQEYFEGRDFFVRGAQDARSGSQFYMVFRRDRLNGWRLTGLSNKKP